jgi:hypothetical protein
VRELKAEVPVHYLFNFSQDRVGEAINRGIEAARTWCDAEGIPRLQSPPVSVAKKPISVRFEEHVSSEDGKVKVRLLARIDDLDSFLSDPNHLASATGRIDLGAEKIDLNEPGHLQVLVDQGDPSKKTIRFAIQGSDCTVTGLRTLAPGVSDREVDLTVERHRQEWWHGTVKPGHLESLREVLGLHIDAPSAAEHAKALARFGAFYFGHLWDVYARRFLPYSPF